MPPLTHPPNPPPPPQYSAPPPPNEGNDDNLEGNLESSPTGMVATGNWDFSQATVTGLGPTSLPNPAIVNSARAATTAELDLAAASSANDVTLENANNGQLRIDAQSMALVAHAAGSPSGDIALNPGPGGGSVDINGGLVALGDAVFKSTVDFQGVTTVDNRLVIDDLIQMGGAAGGAGGAISAFSLKTLTPYTASATISITDDIIDAATSGADTVLTLPPVISAAHVHQFIFIRRTDDTAFSVIIQPQAGEHIGVLGSAWYLGGIEDFVVLAAVGNGDQSWAVVGQSGKRTFNFGPLAGVASSPTITAVSRLGFPAARQLRRIVLDTNGAGAAAANVVVDVGATSFTLLAGQTNFIQIFNPGDEPIAADTSLTAPLVTLHPAGAMPANFCIGLEFD